MPPISGPIDDPGQSNAPCPVSNNHGCRFLPHRIGERYGLVRPAGDCPQRPANSISPRDQANQISQFTSLRFIDSDSGPDLRIEIAMWVGYHSANRRTRRWAKLGWFGDQCASVSVNDEPCCPVGILCSLDPAFVAEPHARP